MGPNSKDLQNLPLENISIKRVGRSVVTRSSLVVTSTGVNNACLFPAIPKRLSLQIKSVGVLSVIKNKLHFFSANGKELFFVMNLWSTGYHHWLAEVVPKFFLFEDELRKGIILLPERRSRFIDEFLQMFEFDNVSYYRDNIFVKGLSVVTNPNSGHFLPDHLRLVKERVVGKLGIEYPRAHRRLYVSRKNARARCVINEMEIIRLLKEFHFEILDLEDVAFGEQVRLFSECETLVSIHGAALTNSIFMPEGGSVIEFYPDGTPENGYFNACYSRMCGTLSLDHEYLLCEREGRPRRFDLDTDNIIVDPAKLREILVEAVSVETV